MENANFQPQQQPPTGVQPNYGQPIPESKVFSRKISFTSGGLLIYNAIMYAIVFAVVIVYMIIEAIKFYMKNGHGKIPDDIFDGIIETDMGMGLSVIIGCIFMTIFFWKRIKPREIFAKRERKMTIGKLIMLVSVLMCIQLPITFLDEAFELILNLFGLSAQAAIESAQAGSTTISMMLYAGFIGPFAEEYVYRGYTMRSLESTGAGKGYALVISSLIFGVMHANPTQSIYAFFAGLVFGYTAIEYGIIWSLLLHIMNNFIFGDVMVFICTRVSETVGEIISWTALIVLFLAGVIVLIVKRKEAREYIKANFNTESKYYKWTFMNILLWIFIGINLVLAMMQITRLEK